LRHVVTELQAAGVDIREVLADELRGLVADVQIHAGFAETLHLMVDGARRRLSPVPVRARLVEARHEARAIRELQQAAFAAHSFR